MVKSRTQSFVLCATLVCAFLSADAQGAWIAPVGVPVPSFGVNEVVPALPSPWTSTVATFYFVCPSCAGATDSGNANGYPSKPRQTIPGLSGPAVVVLDGQINTDIHITANATAASPIFVTSYNPSNPARLTAGFGASGSYVIFDHLWNGPQSSSDNDFGFGVGEGSHHVALRYSELSGNANRSGGIGVGTWSYNGAASASNIVIDHNNIHNLGDVAASSDQDAHCVTLNGSADYVWVTYNTLAYCSGDGMQVEAQAGRRAKIHHVFYGKNNVHHNRQSGGWVKNATDVIFSQNVAHDFRANSGGPGACYGFQYDAEYVWFLYNEAYQCNIGIAISGPLSTPGQYAFIIGNIIHDTNAQSPTDPYNAGAMVIRGGTNVYVVNNTMVNVDAGVNMPPGTSAVYIYNNIIANRTNASTYDLYKEGTNPTLDVKNNLYGTNARFSGGASSGSAAILASPAFVNQTGGDYHLTASSQAVNSGIVSTVYSTFASRYGVDIARDADGMSRPTGAGWDRGAFEFGSGGVPPTTPAAPSNVRLIG